MASPALQIITGGVIGTGAAITVDSIGIRPRVAYFVNADGDSAWWADSMPDASMFLVANSTASEDELAALEEDPVGTTPDPPSQAWGQGVEAAVNELQTAYATVVALVNELRTSASTPTLESTNGITPRANGFSIGANAVLNQSGKKITFWCMG